MRIMVDTNIIISAGLFLESIIGKALSHILKNHSLVLCKYTLNELTSVFKNKFSDRITALNSFTRSLNYELIDIEIKDKKIYPKIRDINDLPILASAIESKVDLLVTGDKDFDDIIIEIPKIIKPRDYITIYIK